MGASTGTAALGLGGAYRPYMAVTKGLLSDDMLDYVRGHQQYADWGGGKFPSWRMCPRIRLTAAGLGLASLTAVPLAFFGRLSTNHAGGWLKKLCISLR